MNEWQAPKESASKEDVQVLAQLITDMAGKGLLGAAAADVYGTKAPEGRMEPWDIMSVLNLLGSQAGRIYGLVGPTLGSRVKNILSRTNVDAYLPEMDVWRIIRILERNPKSKGWTDRLEDLNRYRSRPSVQEAFSPAFGELMSAAPEQAQKVDLEDYRRAIERLFREPVPEYQIFSSPSPEVLRHEIGHVAYQEVGDAETRALAEAGLSSKDLNELNRITSVYKPSDLPEELLVRKLFGPWEGEPESALLTLARNLGLIP